MRALDAEASQPSGAQGVDALRALDVNTLQATVDALRALDIDALHVNTLQAMVDALWALNSSPANPLQYPPAYIPPGAIVFCIPDGMHKHPDGVFWPFPPTPRGLRVAQEAWIAMHTPSELTADTCWHDLVLPYLDEEVRTKGPFPSLGSVVRPRGTSL